MSGVLVIFALCLGYALFETFLGMGFERLFAFGSSIGRATVKRLRRGE